MIAFVNQAAGGSGGTSVNQNLAVTAGNLVVAVGSANSPGRTLSITDANINWTQLSGSPWTDSANSCTTAIWIGTVINSGTDNIAISSNGSPTLTAMSVAQYSGTANYLSALDKMAKGDLGAITSGNPLLTGTTTTTSQPNEMLVACYGLLTAGNTFTQGAGYSLRGNTIGGGPPAIGAGIEDRSVSVTGAYQATITINGNTTGGTGVILALQPPPEIFSAQESVSHYGSEGATSFGNVIGGG